MSGFHEQPDFTAWSVGQLEAHAATLAPGQARALAASLPSLPIEQIGELRRHKNLTAHLDLQIGRLRAGPVKEQLIAWRDVRKQLLP